MAIDKIFYNEASANKLGWTPEWFGCKDYDEELIKHANSAPQLNHESKINPDDNKEFSKIVSISAIVLAFLF